MPCLVGRVFCYIAFLRKLGTLTGFKYLMIKTGIHLRIKNLNGKSSIPYCNLHARVEMMNASMYKRTGNSEEGLGFVFSRI